MYNGPSEEFPKFTVCLTDCFKDHQRFLLVSTVVNSQFGLDGATSAFLQASLVFRLPEDMRSWLGLAREEIVTVGLSGVEDSD
jgi:hypothetical protein